MSRKKKTYHYAITSGCGVYGGVDILGITDNETIARKFCENYNRINDSNLSVEKFRDFKEIGNIYLSELRSNNNYYYFTQTIILSPDGKVNGGGIVGAKCGKWEGTIDSLVKTRVKMRLGKDSEMLNGVYVWAPNETIARAEAEKLFEEFLPEGIKEQLKNQ